MGVEVLYGPVDISLEIASMGPDLRLAIVSRPVVAPRYIDLIREHAPGAKIAYDTVDLHFVREQRRLALGDGRAGKVHTLRELELGLVRGTDMSITVTEDEREILLSHVPDATVVVIPNANAIAERVPGPEARDGILFVGSFEHPPNADAALALVEAVMPLVWEELGPVGVTIVGARPPAEVVELARPEVDVTGWVQDLTPLYESARVMVAPLRYGAGMKGKVTQSLAAGLPVVTTPIGAEGLEAVDGREMMIAERPADLAARIVRVLREDDLWRELSRAGQEVAARLFSPDIMRQQLEELLEVSVAAT
jgi:glycosyltransferase involved in cell wall biosynthesis